MVQNWQLLHVVCVRHYWWCLLMIITWQCVCIWIMRQTRPNTVLWINTCMNTMCYFPIKCHSAGGGASSHQIHSKHGHSSFTQRQRDIWCHHTEPRPVSCAVVTLWLCSNTWDFKCPTRATSDNEPAPLFALQSCGLSSSRWQRIYLFPLQSRQCCLISIWSLQNNIFLCLCSLSELLVLPLLWLHSRWHICICLFAETSIWHLCHTWRPSL